MSAAGADFIVGPHIDLRVELDRSAEPPTTRARWACRCGWVHHSTGRLVIPAAVYVHRERCPYARPDQLTMTGGAA